MSNDTFNLVIFEDEQFSNLLPLVYWRDVSQLRCGALTLSEQICCTCKNESPILFMREVLRAISLENEFGQVAQQVTSKGWTLFVNARALLLDPIELGDIPNVGMSQDDIAYIWADETLSQSLSAETCLNSDQLNQAVKSLEKSSTPIEMIKYPWDLVRLNPKAIQHQWSKLSRPSQAKRVYEGAYLMESDNINFGLGTVVMPGAVLDATNGPIITGENVLIKPNATLEGPLYIGDETIINPNAIIRSCSFGPVCRVGGEVSSSILQGYANKQHDGFLGHSYLGQWTNLGAATTTSNLKNTYGTVRVPINGTLIDSGEIFVGLTMGDFAKSGINTTFATGSVVGLASHVFSQQIPAQFTGSFRWITDTDQTNADVDKVLATAKIMMQRRGIEMSSAQEQLFRQIAASASQFEA